MKDDRLLSVLQAKSLILLFLLTSVALCAQDAGLVQRALTNEVRAATDAQHPMRYFLRKASPRLITTKEICETADGAVARLVAVNDAPLSPKKKQHKQTRLE